MPENDNQIHPLLHPKLLPLEAPPREPDAKSAQLPSWIAPEVDQYNDWIDRTMSPYPFIHPEELEKYVCLHQNDYLRLSQRREVKDAKMRSIQEHGNSYLASTVFTGGRGMEEHVAFRSLLAQTMLAEDALLASSGWSANVGLIEVLAKEGTPVYLDQRAHASLWDGARLSRGRSIMVRHNDPEYLARRIKRDGPGIVCIDAFYSNTGAVADVAAYVEICERTQSVLVLDEAHSLGMTGPGAGGLAVAAGVAERVHFRTASFSKALGGHGGCIAASRHLTWLLTHRARSMVFSSAALPCDSAAHRKALEIAREEPGLAAHVLSMGDLLRKEFDARAIPYGPSACQIVSMEFEHERIACRFYESMRDRGFIVSVFLSPATALGRGLVRFSTHAKITESQIRATADAVFEVLEELGRPGLIDLAA